MDISRKSLQRSFGLLLSFLLLLHLSPVVWASDSTQQTKGRLTVLLEHEYTIDAQKRNIPDVELRLYQVAAMDQDGSMTATKPFQSFQYAIQGQLTQEAWSKLSQELERWLQSNSPAAVGSQRSNADGIAGFEGLAPGLYLLALDEGVHPAQPGIRVGFQTTLVAIPYRGESSDNMLRLEDPEQWDYDFTVIPKSYERREVARLQKIWKDDQNTNKLRPTKLTVEIVYEDSTVQTLVISAESGWLLDFTPSSLRAVKEIREPELPEGYSYVGFECVGTTIQFTNELDTTKKTRTSNTPSSGGNPGLPKTGQLWWPVPVLLVSGAGCILLGLLRQRSRKNRGEA